MSLRVIDKCGIDIVHGCQLRCVGCPNSVIQSKVQRMPVADFAAMLANIDVDHIALLRLFNFGEPILHKELPDILLQIPQQSWSARVVELSTNAQYHDFDMLAEALQTGVLTRLTVSCDGDGSAEDYERLRPPAKWDKLLTFLVRAAELRNRLAPRLQLLTRNVSVTAAGRARWSKLLLPLGWTPEFRDWLYLPGSARNMTGHAPAVRPGVCSFLAPGNRLYVDWDGTVVPCCVHPAAGDLGNLKTQRYSEIQAGRGRLEMMRSMARDRRAMPICGECEF